MTLRFCVSRSPSSSRPVLGAIAFTVTLAAAAFPLRAAAQGYWPINYALEMVNSAPANQIGAAAAQAKGANGKGVEIAVLDSGVNPAHQELSGRIDTARAWNAATGRSGGLSDGLGHGTFVASEIVGNLDGKGMYGVAPLATLLPIQVFAAPMWVASDTTIASAIRYSSGKAAIVSMSLGAPGVQPATATALQAGVKAGQLFAIAAGNSGLANPDWPARYAKETWANGQIIAVGAVDASNRIASFSNRAGDTAKWYLVAPGVNVYGAYAGSTNQYAFMSGTSMATPIVAGAAADLKGYWPQLTAAQVASILFQTADHLGTSKVGTADPIYGWGLLNLTRALQPVGTVLIPTPSGAKLPMSSVVQANGIAVSAAIRMAAVNGDFTLIGLDTFGRQFNYDVGAAVSSVPALSVEQIFGSSDRLLRYSEHVLDDHGSRFVTATESATWAYRLGAMAEYDNRKVQDSALLGAGMVRNFADGTELAFGTGGTNLFFGLQGMELNDAPALTLSAFNNAYASLVPAATSAGWGATLTETLRLKVGVMSSAAAGASYAQVGASAPATSANAALAEVSRAFDGAIVGLQLAQLRESGAWLGTSSGEAFAVGSDASTTVATFNAALRLGHGFAFAGYYSQGITRAMNGADSSLVSQVSSVRTQAFGMGLIRADNLSRGDRFSVSLSQPLRAMSGTMSFTAPSDVTASGAVVYDSRSVSLASPARELLSETSYYTPLGKSDALALTYLTRHNAGNVAGGAENVIGLRYTRLF